MRGFLAECTNKYKTTDAKGKVTTRLVTHDFDQAGNISCALTRIDGRFGKKGLFERTCRGTRGREICCGSVVAGLGSDPRP